MTAMSKTVKVEMNYYMKVHVAGW